MTTGRVDLSLTTTGADDLAGALKEIGKRGAENAIRSAVRATVKPMVKIARSKAPFLTGALKKMIISKVMGFDAKRQVKGYVGVSKGTVDVKVSYARIEDEDLNPNRLGGKLIQSNIRYSRKADESGRKLIDLARTSVVIRKKPEAYAWKQERKYHFLQKTKDEAQDLYNESFRTFLVRDIDKQRAKLAAKQSARKGK
jgi:hypothetical protein